MEVDVHTQLVYLTGVMQFTLYCTVKLYSTTMFLLMFACFCVGGDLPADTVPQVSEGRVLCPLEGRIHGHQELPDHQAPVSYISH